MTDKNMLVRNGAVIYNNRVANASPSYTIPNRFYISKSTPDVVWTDTALATLIPISDGTALDDGSNTMTGSDGGDNSTNNTVTYKEGAGQSDVTAQNLIANNGNASKVWTISDLDTAGSDATATEPFGLWLYIKDATALAKFKSSGTALQIRIGSDASNYYYLDTTAANLASGWNWITSGTVLVNAMSEQGTVSGDLDTFAIVITTNNATDTFVAGDVIYDLLRQWNVTTDLYATVDSTTEDETDASVTIISKLSITQANGFLIDGHALYNTDSTNLMFNKDKFTGNSKSSTDLFKITNKIKIRNVNQ